MLLLNACCLFLPYFCVLFPEINGNFSSLKFALEHFKNPYTEFSRQCSTPSYEDHKQVLMVSEEQKTGKKIDIVQH